MKILQIGTRGSRLALWQAEHVASELKKAKPDLKINIQVIKTIGDKILDVALSHIGDKGLFTKEIENQLIKKNIDIAVHSMKDMPSELEPDLCIGAVLKRENPQDVLISHKDYRFKDLPMNAVIGTSSLRRAALLKVIRPDISTVDIRGNVETRIRKMKEQNLDGIILAFAGVRRLGFEGLITDILPCDLLMPAVGQGAIAIECRSADQDILKLLQEINHRSTFLATMAERGFLNELEGGCQVPIGSLAYIKEEILILQGVVASLNGKKCFRASREGNCQDAELIGRQLARQLLQEGAGRILQEIRNTGD